MDTERFCQIYPGKNCGSNCRRAEFTNNGTGVELHRTPPCWYIENDSRLGDDFLHTESTNPERDS